MFQWDKTIKAINLPASTVVNLFRSMREVQLALPGIPAQEASAYLCQYRAETGVGTVVVFHLHKSRMLAFYSSDPQFVPQQKIDSMLDQGLNFVESMGFLMTDQDIHLLDHADQGMLWASLPLKAGLVQKEQAAPTVTQPQKPAPKPAVEVKASRPSPVEEDNKAAVIASSKPVVKESPADQVSPTVSEPEVADNVDDLLAAVEAMRTKRPGLRARKTLPSPEEMNRRRLILRETVGRILASQ